MAANNKLLVPGLEQAFDKMKYEIAAELGVDTSEDSTASGDMTKRLVSESQQQSKNDQ